MQPDTTVQPAVRAAEPWEAARTAADMLGVSRGKLLRFCKRTKQG